MKQSKNFPITFLQVISAVAVVYLHTNGCFWNFSATEFYWKTANVIECVCYFAVPVFFMITGITLMDYQDRYSTKVYFIKRLDKTLIPYVCWSIIGVFHNLYMGKITMKDVNPEYLIKGLLSGDSIINIYWFFIPLFCVYLAMPLFAAVDKDKRKGIFTYLLIAGFLINNLVPFVLNVYGQTEMIPWKFHLNVISAYYFWVLCGYMLYNYPPKKKTTLLLLLMGCVGLLMHIIGTMKLSIEAGQIISTYKGYVNVPCIMYTVAVFLAFKKIGEILAGTKARILIEKLGKYTFPIYLMHYYILQYITRLLGKMKFLGFDNTSLLFRLVSPLFIVTICIAITWLLRKIPVVKKIVP